MDRKEKYVKKNGSQRKEHQKKGKKEKEQKIH